jgi:hypothetical protein
MLCIARAASEIAKARNRTLIGGGGCRLSVPARETMTAGSECLRGHSLQNAVPSGAGRQPCGTERVISPAPFLGALRGIPAHGVAKDSEAAAAQGKAFPLTWLKFLGQCGGVGDECGLVTPCRQGIFR